MTNITVAPTLENVRGLEDDDGENTETDENQFGERKDKPPASCNHRFGTRPRRRGHDREPAGHARPDDDECLVRDHDGVYPYAPPRDRRVVGNLVGVYIAFVCFHTYFATQQTDKRALTRPLARSHSAPARARASTRRPGRRNSSGTPRRRRGR